MLFRSVMGVSASMAKRTVFLDGEGVRQMVSVVDVVFLEVSEALLVDVFFFLSAFL